MATLIPSFKKDNPFKSIKDNELIGLTLNDEDGPAPDILWSSAKVKKLIPSSPCNETFQEKQTNAVSGNLAKFDEGTTIDSGFSLNDSSPPASNVLWSSEKIANIPLPPFQLKQSDAINDNIAIFGSDINLGQVVDSGFKINDFDLPSSKILYSSAKIQELLPASQISFLTSALPNDEVHPSSGILYIGNDGSSYIWNGSSYKGVLAKAYCKLISRTPLSVPPGSNMQVQFPIVESSGLGSCGIIFIGNGEMSIGSTSQAPTLYKVSFVGQGLSAENNSIQASFSFFNEKSKEPIGNSSSIFSFTIGSLVVSTQCYLQEYFLIPPLEKVVFSVKISTKASDPLAILGSNGVLDNPYLTIEQIY
jgi:hypothetical protein